MWRLILILSFAWVHPRAFATTPAQAEAAQIDQMKEIVRLEKFVGEHLGQLLDPNRNPTFGSITQLFSEAGHEQLIELYNMLYSKNFSGALDAYLPPNRELSLRATQPNYSPAEEYNFIQSSVAATEAAMVEAFSDPQQIKASVLRLRQELEDISDLPNRRSQQDQRNEHEITEAERERRLNQRKEPIAWLRQLEPDTHRHYLRGIQGRLVTETDFQKKQRTDEEGQIQKEMLRRLDILKTKIHQEILRLLPLERLHVSVSDLPQNIVPLTEQDLLHLNWSPAQLFSTLDPNSSLAKRAGHHKVFLYMKVPGTGNYEAFRMDELAKRMILGIDTTTLSFHGLKSLAVSAATLRYMVERYKPDPSGPEELRTLRAYVKDYRTVLPIDLPQWSKSAFDEWAKPALPFLDYTVPPTLNQGRRSTAQHGTVGMMKIVLAYLRLIEKGTARLQAREAQLRPHFLNPAITKLFKTTEHFGRKENVFGNPMLRKVLSPDTADGINLQAQDYPKHQVHSRASIQKEHDRVIFQIENFQAGSLIPQLLLFPKSAAHFNFAPHAPWTPGNPTDNRFEIHSRAPVQVIRREDGIGADSRGPQDILPLPSTLEHHINGVEVLDMHGKPLVPGIDYTVHVQAGEASAFVRFTRPQPFDSLFNYRIAYRERPDPLGQSKVGILPGKIKLLVEGLNRANLKPMIDEITKANVADTDALARAQSLGSRYPFESRGYGEGPTRLSFDNLGHLADSERYYLGQCTGATRLGDLLLSTALDHRIWQIEPRTVFKVQDDGTVRSVGHSLLTIGREREIATLYDGQAPVRESGGRHGRPLKGHRLDYQEPRTLPSSAPTLDLGSGLQSHRAASLGHWFKNLGPRLLQALRKLKIVPRKAAVAHAEAKNPPPPPSPSPASTLPPPQLTEKPQASVPTRAELNNQALDKLRSYADSQKSFYAQTRASLQRANLEYWFFLEERSKQNPGSFYKKYESFFTSYPQESPFVNPVRLAAKMQSLLEGLHAIKDEAALRAYVAEMRESRRAGRALWERLQNNRDLQKNYPFFEDTVFVSRIHTLENLVDSYLPLLESDVLGLHLRGVQPDFDVSNNRLFLALRLRQNPEHITLPDVQNAVAQAIELEANEAPEQRWVSQFLLDNLDYGPGDRPVTASQLCDFSKFPLKN